MQVIVTTPSHVLVIVLRHISLIIPDSEYAMKLEVVVNAHLTSHE